MSYLQRKYRELLVWLQLPLWYQRVVVWWEYHSDLRERLKAARLFVLHRSIELRNATFGSMAIVATRQIQSRQELSGMDFRQIMAAWRAGRLDYLMAQEDDGVKGYGDKTFQEWVNNGGQMRQNVRRR